MGRADALLANLGQVGNVAGSGLALGGQGLASGGRMAGVAGTAVAGAAWQAGKTGAKTLLDRIIPKTRKELFILFATIVWIIDYFTIGNKSIFFAMFSGVVLAWLAITWLYKIPGSTVFSRVFFIYLVAGLIMRGINEYAFKAVPGLNSYGSFSIYIAIILATILVVVIINRINSNSESGGDNVTPFITVAVFFCLHNGGMEAINLIVGKLTGWTNLWYFSTIALPPWVILGLFFAPSDEEGKCAIPALMGIIIVGLWLGNLVSDLHLFERFSIFKGTTPVADQEAAKEVKSTISTGFKTFVATAFVCPYKGVTNMWNVAPDGTSTSFDMQACIDERSGRYVEVPEERQLDGQVDPDAKMIPATIEFKALDNPPPVYTAGTKTIPVRALFTIEDNGNSDTSYGEEYTLDVSCRLGKSGTPLSNIEPIKVPPDENFFYETVYCNMPAEDYLENKRNDKDTTVYMTLASNNMNKLATVDYYGFFMGLEEYNDALKSKKDSVTKEDIQELIAGSSSTLSTEELKAKADEKIMSELFPSVVKLKYPNGEITPKISGGPVSILMQISTGAFVGIRPIDSQTYSQNNIILEFYVRNNANGEIKDVVNKNGKKAPTYFGSITLPEWLVPVAGKCKIVDLAAVDARIIKEPEFGYTSKRIVYPLANIDSDFGYLEPGEQKLLETCELTSLPVRDIKDIVDNPSKPHPFALHAEIRYDYEWEIKQKILHVKPSGSYAADCGYDWVDDPDIQLPVTWEEPCISQETIALVLQESQFDETWPNSVPEDIAGYIYEYGAEYKIDPAILLAFWKKESSMGTNGPVVNGPTYNPGNIVQRTDECDEFGTGEAYNGARQFCVFRSDWEAAVEAWYKYIYRRYVTYESDPRVTVEEIVPRYLLGKAECSMGSDEGDESPSSCEMYINQIRDWVACYREKEEDSTKQC